MCPPAETHVENEVVTMHGSVRHVIDNLGTFGFGSPALGLVQATKELVDNSVDAIVRARSVDERSHAADGSGGGEGAAHAVECSGAVSVSLERHPQEQDWWVLICADEGCGMDDAVELLNCFTSGDGVAAGVAGAAGAAPTAAEGAASLSRFGMGLSAVVLYSQLTTGQPTTLVTKSASSGVVTAQCSFDLQSGSPVVVHLPTTPPVHAVTPGTLVRVLLPTPTGPTAPAAITAAISDVRARALFPPNPCTLPCTLPHTHTPVHPACMFTTPPRSEPTWPTSSCLPHGTSTSPLSTAPQPRPPARTPQCSSPRPPEWR